MEERVRGEGVRHGSREKEVVNILFSWDIFSPFSFLIRLWILPSLVLFLLGELRKRSLTPEFSRSLRSSTIALMRLTGWKFNWTMPTLFSAHFCQIRHIIWRLEEHLSLHFSRSSSSGLVQENWISHREGSSLLWDPGADCESSGWLSEGCSWVPKGCWCPRSCKGNWKF